ncbi:hypothetical protein GGR57DRAFT_496103 [Xylariaceae sp. FL1272]|nr:hypothetical protein GGR57DRAFT_496103 [Xylariaceae sp. FL1272]
MSAPASSNVLIRATSLQLAAQCSGVSLCQTRENGTVRAARDLALDFGRIVGVNGTVIQTDSVNASYGKSVVIAGTIGSSSLIDDFARQSLIDITEREGKWESYVQQVVTQLAPGIAQALVIAGSDKRGTIYGMYTSPRPWGSVPGIFINDETELIAWAKGKFEKSPLGLLLRLRASYLWPGMETTEIFYMDDPLNGVHHEPMARAYNEQLDFLDGSWDWSENRGNVTEFMRYGVQRAKNWEARADPESVPQVWTRYKKVGKYWQDGMDMAGDVTLMFTDDNCGNLLRVPLANETARSGGFGMNHHFGYIAAPRDYCWISEIQLVKTWEQMHIAYENQVQQVWIANVEDIKPFEVPMNHFLDMAYDMSKFTTPNSTADWLKRWSRREFGDGIEDTVAEVFNICGRLILRRHYETLTMEPFPYSALHYDETASVLQEWDDLVALAQAAYDELTSPMKEIYYELVLNTVVAGRNVYALYVHQQIGSLYQAQQRTSTNLIAAQARATFAADAANTQRYNALYGGKRVGIMSSPHIGYSTRDPPAKNIMPTMVYVQDAVNGSNISSGALGVAVPGSNLSAPGLAAELVLSPVNPYLPPAESRYLDVFAPHNGTFTYQVQHNASYISVTSSTGTLHAPGNLSDVRCEIDVDWDSAPTGLSWARLDVLLNSPNSTSSVAVWLPVNKTAVPDSFGGFVESNGVVTIEPAHYTSAEAADDISYIEISYYGRTSSGVKLWPVTAATQTAETGPKLIYDFYTFSSVSNATLIVYTGGTTNYEPLAPLRLAYALDGGEAVTKQVMANYAAGDSPVDWDTAVINGGWNVTFNIDVVGSGGHALGLWLLEPGVVSSMLGPPESRRVGE